MNSKVIYKPKTIARLEERIRTLKRVDKLLDVLDDDGHTLRVTTPIPFLVRLNDLIEMAEFELEFESRPETVGFRTPDA